MLKFYADRYLSVVRLMGGISVAVTHGMGVADAGVTLVANNQKQQLALLLLSIREHCDDIGLTSTVDQINRILLKSDSALTYLELETLHGELHNRLEDELGHELLLHVDRKRAKYYDVHGFDSSVLVSFPAASLDIEEAGKCFALDRWTACVFHLMRVMEHGLRALADYLSVPCDFKTWDAIIKKMRSEVEDYKKSSFKGNLDFIRQSLDRLTAVQTALRNEVMHARSFYDEERVSDVYTAVKGFMQQLGTELKAAP